MCVYAYLCVYVCVCVSRCVFEDARLTADERPKDGRDGQYGVGERDLFVSESDLLHVKGDVGQERERSCGTGGGVT